MNFVISADIHLHPYSDFATIEDGMNSRLLDGLKVVRQMKEYCIANEVPTMIINGDTHQDRLSLETDTLYYIQQEFEQCYEAGLDLIWNTGNHDQHDKAGNIYTTKTLSMLGNVVNTPEILEVNGTIFYIVPFMYDCDPVRQIIKDFAKKSRIDKGVLLLHQGVNGAYVGPYDFVMKENLIVRDLMSKSFDWVILGHYHKHQFLNTNTFYTGSPMELNYGERGKASGFVHVSDQFDKGYKFVRTEAPRFIELQDTKITEKVLKRHVNDFLIVKNYEMSEEELLQKLQGFKYRIVRMNKEQHQTRTELSTILSHEEIVERYVQERGSAGMNEELLIDLGKAVVRGVV